MEDTSWFEVTKTKPPLHISVLVELKEGIGTTCDVACYVGKVDTGNGVEDRWILSDVRLESRQIKRWAHIYPAVPPNMLARAIAAERARLSAILESDKIQNLKARLESRMDTEKRLGAASDHPLNAARLFKETVDVFNELTAALGTNHEQTP